ncbi:MAG: hypothetical protein ACJ8AI_10255 [Rhodopila sp.]
MSAGKRVVTTGITTIGTGGLTATTHSRDITVTTRRRAISSQYADIFRVFLLILFAAGTTTITSTAVEAIWGL